MWCAALLVAIPLPQSRQTLRAVHLEECSQSTSTWWVQGTDLPLLLAFARTQTIGTCCSSADTPSAKTMQQQGSHEDNLVSASGCTHERFVLTTADAFLDSTLRSPTLKRAAMLLSITLTLWWAPQHFRGEHDPYPNIDSPR